MSIERIQNPAYDTDGRTLEMLEMDRAYEQQIQQYITRLQGLLSRLPLRCCRELRQEAGHVYIGPVKIVVGRDDGYLVVTNDGPQFRIADSHDVRRIVAELWASGWFSDGEMGDWLRGAELRGWLEERGRA